jgi:hypothetical protein
MVVQGGIKNHEAGIRYDEEAVGCMARLRSIYRIEKGRAIALKSKSKKLSNISSSVISQCIASRLLMTPRP